MGRTVNGSYSDMVRNLVLFQNYQIGSGAHCTCYSLGTEASAKGMIFTAHLNSVPRLRAGGALSLPLSLLSHIYLYLY
jgi:hypothetical protein